MNLTIIKIVLLDTLTRIFFVLRGGKLFKRVQIITPNTGLFKKFVVFSLWIFME